MSNDTLFRLATTLDSRTLTLMRHGTFLQPALTDSLIRTAFLFVQGLLNRK
jgi:hypothetical protein